VEVNRDLVTRTRSDSEAATESGLAEHFNMITEKPPAAVIPTADTCIATARLSAETRIRP
jgi:hypothetical protein